MDRLEKDICLAVDLSKQIVSLAQEKDWSQMEQLDIKRIGLLKAVFSDQSLNIEEHEFKEQLQTIIDLNNKAMDLCSQAKEEMLIGGRELRRGRDAISAYKEQSSDD